MAYGSNNHYQCQILAQCRPQCAPIKFKKKKKSQGAEIWDNFIYSLMLMNKWPNTSWHLHNFFYRVSEHTLFLELN